MSTEELRPEHSTKASRMGEFMQEGKWRLTNRFMLIPPVAIVNGHWEGVQAGAIQGEVIGNPTGENFLSCYFCGTGINDHLTFTDRETGRQVNIGNVCVEHIWEASHNRDFEINKGLESLKSKVVREFKKKTHRKYLLEFLDAGMEKWQKPINDKIDTILEGNDKAYWNPPTRTIQKGDKTFEVKATLWEQKDGAEERERSDRNPIKDLREKFANRGWNVKPLIPEFQKLINDHGFDDVVPNPKPLTAEETLQMQKEIQVHIDDYFKKSEVRKN
jgi:hypothetical protein